MEYCEGGQLFKYLVSKEHLTEQAAAKIMRQIFNAIAYCHEQNICHRDIKPENFLLKYVNDDSCIKLIDFGLAKKLQKDQQMESYAGTLLYFAPEMLEGNYGQEVDNWSLGVVLYILLSGQPPFYGKTKEEILQSIKKGQYSFNLKQFYQCSVEVKDLVSKLLQKDPKRRLQAKAALYHPWILQQAKLEQKNLVIDKKVFLGIQQILEFQSLQKTFFVYLAQQIPEKEIENLKQIFINLDKNNNGTITLDEFLEGMIQFEEIIGTKINKEDLTKVYKAMDFDQSGQIEYTEFIANFINNILYQNDKFLMECFAKIDKDNSGKINKQELLTIINGDIISLEGVDIDDLMQEADTNGDGEIDYEEFITLLKIKQNIIKN